MSINQHLSFRANQWSWSQKFQSNRGIKRYPFSMTNSKLLRFNKGFINICANLASVNTNFNLPSGRLSLIIDRLTMVWSIIILITSLVKFFTFDEYLLLEKSSDYPNIRDVITLNTLPNINDFGKLYYGLMSMSIGAPLMWRIYLNFYAPSSDYRHNAKSNLVRFLMDGKCEVDHKTISISSMATVFARCVSVLEDAKEQSNICKLKQPLTILHLPNRSLGGIQGAYRNPIRDHNFEEFTPYRWKVIARHTYTAVMFVVILALPILYFTINGLHSVMKNFTTDKDTPLVGALQVYGALEQIYSCIQGALFFVFTNVFITVFHADIIFKSKQLHRTLEELNRFYLLLDSSLQTSLSKKEETELSINEQVYKQQLKLWSYFDNILQLDTFVSKYSLISIITFIIGLSFGQSYLKVADPDLKWGTAAVLITNIISFSYLYVISWDIEKRNIQMHRLLMSIVARDDDFVTKRLWQKTLFGFYEGEYKRTFTMDNRYPLNLHSLFKTIFGLLTMSLVMNRLFHKRAWESSFGSISRQ